MKKVLLIVCLVYSVFIIHAQDYTISGFVEDSLSGEALINAALINSLTSKGVVTNDYGFFSISTKQNSIQLNISYVGYNKQSLIINHLSQDTLIKVQLTPNNALDEVTIVAHKNQKNVQSTQVSLSKIDVKKTALLPVLIGEADLVKTIQLLPGVQSGTEGTGGLQVRGGGQGENLVLLDGAPVYNVNHLFGFFSVFNTDAIQNVDLYKGGFPARYGGRLSSVLDVRMKEGNSQKFEGSGSIGLISSKLTLQGPIIKDKTSFIVSARRTYLDLLIKPLIKDFGYYFYDANAKINHRFSPKSRLYLSFYTGKDEMFLNLNDDFLSSDSDDESYGSDNFYNKTGWGNITSSLRWNYIFNSKLFLNSSLIYSKYLTSSDSDVNTEIFEQQNQMISNIASNLQNTSALLDFTYAPNTEHSIKFGGSYSYLDYLPIRIHTNELIDSVPITDTTQWNERVYANEMHFYVEDDIDISSKFKANIGLHASFYNVNNAWYKALEPRISMRYLLRPNLSFKVAYTEMNQYVFQYPNVVEIFKKGNNLTISANPEVWLPATDKLLPQKSKQLVAGTFLSLHQGYNLSVEGFYKTLSNVIRDRSFSDNQDPVNDWEDLFEQGKGTSYGLEFFLEKNSNKTTGWIAYTLSKTDRQFANVNKGNTFPSTFDRRHNLNIVVNHKFSDKFDMGLVWTYGSGRKMTLPDGQYISNLNINTGTEYENKNDIAVQSKINAYTLPVYHRLDIGVNFHKQKQWGTSTWSMGLYNAYNHHNSFLIYVDYDEIKADSKVMKSVALFPIIPYITYSFKF